MKLKKKEVIKYRDDIISLYNSGKSSYQIADEYNTHAGTIRQVLIGLNGIKLRSVGEAQFNRFANYKKVSDNMLEHIDGWLLGDGSISIYGSKKQARFTHVSKHEEYIDYIINLFKSDGIKCRKHKNQDKVYKTFHYRMITESTIQFREIYERWYSNKKKIVPENLNLTSNIIKNWIYDDGTTSPTKGHLRLCTCGFSVKENELLALKLSKYIGKSKNIGVIEKASGNPRIYCSKIDANKILTKIGKYDINCFSYKWKNNFKCVKGVQIA